MMTSPAPPAVHCFPMGREISALVWEFYSGLGKSGKTVDSEWTTLAAIVQSGGSESGAGELSVVAVATGTKCVTGSKSRSHNNIIADSHAESLLKRCFKRYLLSQLGKGYDYSSSCSTNKLHPLQVHSHHHKHQILESKQLLPDYYMFVSQLPCGTIDRYEGCSRDESVYRIHRKPGKGEPCLKASCTDKIAKWLLLGLQGRRLTQLLDKPILLKGIVIGNCVRIPEFDEEIFRTRICPPVPGTDQIEANKLSHPFRSPATDIEIIFDESFQKECLTRAPGKRACPSAIAAWFEGRERKVEVIVEGRKQGLGRKSNGAGSLRVSSDAINSDIDTILSKGLCIRQQSQQSYEKQWRHLLNTERFKGYEKCNLADTKQSDAAVQRSAS